MQISASETYSALRRQIEDVICGRGGRRMFAFSSALSSWRAAASAADARETEQTLKDIREVLMLKAALDRRRWAASGRLTAKVPAFESEWTAQIANRRLGEDSQLSDSAFRRELNALEAVPDDVLEAIIRRVGDRLGAVQPMTISLGCALEFVPLDEGCGVG